jgi:GR25 family glycosyltransferase involved in LPS biosynthesis
MFEIITHLLIIVLLLILFILIWKINTKEGLINYLDGIDIIYWINLDRSPERRNNMEKMFQDNIFIDISNERFSAIDGNNPHTINKIEHRNPNEESNVYACLLSHLESIRKFNNSNYDIALILEDDCTLDFKKYWKKSVKEIINNAPKDWEIIMLSYYFEGDSHILWDWSKMKNDYTDHETYSALSYIINKKGSNKLINEIYKNDKYTLKQHLSPHADRYIFMSLKTYVYKYPMFIYKTENDSTLGHNIQEHIQFKNHIIEEYSKIT